MRFGSSQPEDASAPVHPTAHARAVSRVGLMDSALGLDAPAETPATRDRLRTRPKLRLVGADQVVKPAITPQQHAPITDTADPRWVLAVRTAEQLEGTVLPPAKRERLLQVGRMLGLTPFDANLVLAIVQDQARRGHAPAYCAAAGEPQLRMVPLPTRRPWTLKKWLTLGILVCAFVAGEIALLAMFFGG